MEQDLEEDGIPFVRWGEIKQFHNLVASVKNATNFSQEWTTADKANINFPFILKPIQVPVIYKAKIKLHGQNAGITLCGDHVKAQSRNKFAGEWIGIFHLVFGKDEAYFKSLIPSTGTMTIFGEFCGPKVQKGVALTKLKENIFAVFAIDIQSKLIVEPEQIRQVMTKQGQIQLPSDVYILPWYGPQEGFSVDYKALAVGTDEGLSGVLERIEEQVKEIHQIDPWVKETFGVEGPGEGLVLYPVNLQEYTTEIPDYKSLTKQAYECFAFKAIGEKFRVVATKKSVQVNPEVAAGVDAFVDLMCPVPRLEQGAGEVGGYHMSKREAFLDWVVKDVQKEGKDELAASRLEWKDVTTAILVKASIWYTFICRAKAKLQRLTLK